MSSTANARRDAPVRPALTRGEPAASHARVRAPRPWTVSLQRPAAKILVAGGLTFAGWLLGAALSGSTATAADRPACPEAPVVSTVDHAAKPLWHARHRKSHHATGVSTCAVQPKTDSAEPPADEPQADAGDTTAAAAATETTKDSSAAEEPAASAPDSSATEGAGATTPDASAAEESAATTPDSSHTEELAATASESTSSPEPATSATDSTSTEGTGATTPDASTTEDSVATSKAPTTDTTSAEEPATTAAESSSTEAPATKATTSTAPSPSGGLVGNTLKNTLKAVTGTTTKDTAGTPPKATSSGVDLLGGLVGSVLDVVTGTLSTVTDTVGAVTDTLSHTVLAPLTQPPAGRPDAPVLLPLDDILAPVFGGSSNSGGVTATVPGVTAVVTQVPVAVVETVPATVPAAAAPQTSRAVTHLVVRHAPSLPVVQEQPRDSDTHATGGGGDSTPGLPGGTTAPSAPAPTAAPGHDGSGGARHAFAVHTDDVTTTQLKLIGTSRDHEVDGAGREAALPTTSPD